MLAIGAIALPTLLAYNVPPSATFLNQAGAFIGWGLWLLVLVASRPASLAPTCSSGVLTSIGGFIALIAAALCSSAWASLPNALALAYASTLAAAVLTMCGGAIIGRSDKAEPAFRALCTALVIAGVLSVAVSVVQVFIPGWADGNWIAAGAFDGRASGNLRQPNHLSSLLLWSLIATLWLFESGHLRRWVAAALATTFILAVTLTASRTGVVGVGVLTLWGVLDRRLSRSTRTLLMLAPVIYLLCWAAVSGWSHFVHHGTSAEARILDTSESPNSRLRIWANTLSLIAQHPWLGVGFGEFNFAWSLTPFPHRPTAFFDHTHNLILQLMVELGLPLSTLVLGLFAYALWRAFAASRDAAPPRATMLRAAFMMVLMILVHSMFEYPLWYAYFLLPTAFLWGLCLGGDAPRTAVSSPTADGDVPQTASRGIGSRWLMVGSALMLVGGVLSIVDYWRVTRIFTADEGAAPLAQRIAEGERSWLFAHHAHYAAATTAEHPSQAMASLKIATHYLLDTRLMMAWAKAYDEAGDVERARYIAERLREFRNEDSKEFFAVCDEPVPAGQSRPFQCTPPTKQFDYRDFR